MSRRRSKEGGEVGYFAVVESLRDRLVLHFVGGGEWERHRHGGEGNDRGRRRRRLSADERSRAVFKAGLAMEGVARVCTGDGRGEMPRADDLEWVCNGIAVLVHLVVMIYERDAEAFIGHHR